MLSSQVVDAIATITIDQPPVNALPPDAWGELAGMVATHSADTSIRAIVLQGTAGAFCAGADIRGLAAGDSEATGGTPALLVVGAAADAIRGARAPVIAAIDGPAHGGGLELALACDVRIASPSATFAAAGVNMGLLASVGSLVTAIGDSRARAMLLSAARIDADQAEMWGIVTLVTGDPRAAARNLAEQIASKPPLAVEATKRAANAAATMTAADHEALMTTLFTELSTTADHAEALAAFLEKRPGVFDRR